MSVKAPLRHAERFRETPFVDVTIVMPCLNEIVSLPHCIANAKEALESITALHGLTGEIVVADNGSDDGSQQLATQLGARVVPVPQKGYGAALIGGCEGAFGRFVLMGDADGSYDFTEGVAMIGQLLEGADLCMGSRFAGGIVPGAMPWKNRYIGNPVLTGILNLFFGSGVSDAHCGLRAITKEAFQSLRLSGTGMEFASEMVIKASLKKLRIAEVPATLSKDLRDRAPHLRPWRDGWRHLRYLLMLSPTWAFGVPGLMAMSVASLILLFAILHFTELLGGTGPFGTSWTIAAGFLFVTGHFASLMAIVSYVHAAREGFRLKAPFPKTFASLLNLETMLIVGSGLMLLSVAAFVGIAGYWSASGFAALPNTLPLVISAIVGVTGAQTFFGGFLLSIIAGHRADFGEDTLRAVETAQLPLEKRTSLTTMDQRRNPSI